MKHTLTIARIFRKIRQGLLNENENRFIRYLLYVIGEIVFVVIGIIIALQANNLHENHVDHIFENNILREIRTSLQIDLERDSLILENRVLVKTRAIYNLMGLMKH